MVGVKRPMPGVTYIPNAVLEYYAGEGVLKDETLSDALTASCARWPDRVALSEPGVTITYRQFDEITDRAAAALHRLGLRPLDRVIFQAINSKELLFAFFGCIKAGLIPICTLAAHRAHEILQIGGQAEAKAHIVSYAPVGFDLVEFALEMRDRLPSVEHVIAIQCGMDTPHGAPSFEALWQAEDPGTAKATVARIRAELDPYQVCVFQLSGGTSGTPKIIPRFHNEYVYTAGQISRFFGFDETVVSFTPNPMMHNMPMACFILPALLVGGEVAIATSPKIEMIAAAIKERRPTWCAIMLVHILRLKELGLIDENSFAGAYGLICPEKPSKLSALINAPAYTLFGMTEGLLCHTRKEDSLAAIEISVGNSISPYDEIRLVEPGSERDVEPGQIGELIVRGPSVTRGYYMSPERNAEAFTSDHYYRSGDLLSWRIVDGKRYLSFEGRVKDVIDRGGEKINASEVERLMNEHPKITATMCVGMPDPAFGERMCAFVVLAEGATGIELAEVTQHLDGLGVAKFKFPERIEIVHGFPIAVSGKPSKPMLRDMITQKLAEERAQQEKVA
ncbi:Long-chain-fatty-acid--CoA ligase [Sphingobium chlorophenolicum]|uniref:Long-chain-fatty-acid--CoA ligase n=2 Tax=Sphingobium chlorophenolicum TaxID=46429 RepID=A0A081R9D0_SPHCR|nr:Long-chain-fatty-acid--CoA ligase [Sphingobium chlorophenolicum]